MNKAQNQMHWHQVISIQKRKDTIFIIIIIIPIENHRASTHSSNEPTYPSTQNAPTSLPISLNCGIGICTNHPSSTYPFSTSVHSAR